MLRYLFVDITLYDSRLFYAYTVVSVVYCSFLGIRLRIYDWTSGKGSRLGRQCACSVVRFAFLGLIVYMKRKNQKRKKKKKTIHVCHGGLHVLVISMFIYIPIPVLSILHVCIPAGSVNTSIHFLLHPLISYHPIPKPNQSPPNNTA